MVQDNNQKKSLTKYAVVAFVAVMIFGLIYKYTLNQLHIDGISDTKEHTWIAEAIYLDTFWDAWLKRPYLFWHLCVKGCIKFFLMPADAAAAFTNGFLAGLTCLLTFYLLDRTGEKFAGKDVGIPAALAAGVLGIVNALYVPWFNQYQYIGQFSINPISNPTHMAVKPFGLICFMLAVELILNYKGQEAIYFSNIKKPRWLYILFSIFLFLSTFTKPTFMYMLVPAGVVYLLIDLGIALARKDGSWKKVWSFMWRIACACIPSLLYLLFEYLAFYYWGGTNEDSQVAIYPFLTAWHLFSPNVPRSIRLAMAFPLWMVLTNLKYFFKSVEGRLSLIGYATGTLEFAFFVETGDKLAHLNFAWPMMSGMLLLWVISTAKLIGITANPSEHRGDSIVVLVGWILLLIHFYSGLFYINPTAYVI